MAIITGPEQTGEWTSRGPRPKGLNSHIVWAGDETKPPYERVLLSTEQLQPIAFALSIRVKHEVGTHGIEFRAPAILRDLDRAQRTNDMMVDRRHQTLTKAERVTRRRPTSMRHTRRGCARPKTRLVCAQ
ncbi:hypothetical protein ParKJ_40285 [Paraburkholderia fungorum]|uniref:Uncharacterized protein n=1 Tax=Paraburkholderia fungorum TaxID=134537 RepID=A0AAP5V0S1_9BURK|nr:hypothetical protein [Paraburkholderia fungorum]MDT8843644.1 hypothetical protein [Paraburkholderia fungorum]